VNTKKFAGVAVRGSARRRTLRATGILGASALIAMASIVATIPPAAYATSYPSWSDVVAARASTAATQAATTKINSLISSLNSQLQTAQADATAKGEAAYTAEQTYFAAEAKQKTLQEQVDVAAARAAKSHKQVAEYVAQLARGAGDGGGTTLQLFLNGKTAGQVLNDLGAIGQISQGENDIYKLALSQQKTAKQLTTLATAQAGILAGQKQAADAAEAAATAAAANLQTAVTAQTAHQQTLTLQLAALTTKLKMTEKQYAAGVAAAAAAAAASGGSGGTVGSAQPGAVDAQGWALPTIGVITSPWGYRYDPADNYNWQMHYGDDIADGCLQPIYAAHAGTVTYVGPYGDIGNYVIINDGDQYSTAYGHIANGETFVHIGQHVAGGQNIARTGSTGTSTGCHLYFQVMVNGSPVNPAPFMQARGIILGRL
jgi:murein DD-endopeptidase MepM/ murein hydrolase activator NlpD